MPDGNDNGKSWPILGPLSVLAALLAGIATSVATLTQLLDQPFYVRLVTIAVLGGLTLLSVVEVACRWPKQRPRSRPKRRFAIRVLVLRGIVVLGVAGLEVLLLRFATGYKSVRMYETEGAGRRYVVLRAPHSPTDLSLTLFVDQRERLEVFVEQPLQHGLASFENEMPHKTTVRLDGFGDAEELRLRMLVASNVMVYADGRPANRNVGFLDANQFGILNRWCWLAGGIVCIAGFTLAWYRSRWLLRILSPA